MAQIHILDGQHSHILRTITAKNLLTDEHYQSLKDTVEKYEFTAIADIKYSSYLGKHNRIVIPDEDGNYLEFVITESINHGEEVEVYSDASWNLLKKAGVIVPQILAGVTSSTATSFALSNLIWQPGIITFAGSRTIHITEHINPYHLLKRIASEFGLELKFRIEVKENRIVGRYVDLLPRIGGWIGREVKFKKDLLHIKRRELTTNLVTSLHGIGPEREDGTRLEVVVEDQEALARWGEGGRHLIETYEPETEDQDMTLERLTQLTQMELSKRVNALVEYEGDIADLEHVPGLENKKIRFGDTIKIKDTKFNPPLYLEARVHTMRRSIKNKSRKYVELGDYIEYTEDQVNAIWKSLQAQIRQKVSMTDVMEVTYTKQEVDAKDESVFQDGTYYSDQVSENAKQEAIDTAAGDATEKANNAENKAKEHANQKAEEAESNSKDYTNAVEQSLMNTLGTLQTEMGNLQLSVDEDIADLQSTANTLIQRANEQEVELSAAGGRLVSVEQNIDTINGRVDTTITQLTSIDGVVSEQQTVIQQHAGLISEKASIISVDTLTGRVTTTESNISSIAGELAFKANEADVYTKSYVDTELGKKVDTTVYTNKMSQLDININGILADVSKIESEVSEVGSRLTTAQAQLDIQATLIEQRVTETTFTTEIGQKADQEALTTTNNNLSGLTGRVSTAESTIIQHATDIGLRVMKDGVIGAINLSSEQMKIDVAKVSINGDVEISGGNLRIKQGIITNSMVASTANIDFAKISNIRITNAMIESIDASKISTGILRAIVVDGAFITGTRFQNLVYSGSARHNVMIDQGNILTEFGQNNTVYKTASLVEGQFYATMGDIDGRWLKLDAIGLTRRGKYSDRSQGIFETSLYFGDEGEFYIVNDNSNIITSVIIGSELGSRVQLGWNGGGGIFDGELVLYGGLRLGSGHILGQNWLDISAEEYLRLGRFTNNANFAVNVMRGNNSTDVSHRFAGAGTSYVNRYTGNFGVGTTSPTEKLEVAGNIRNTNGGSVIYANSIENDTSNIFYVRANSEVRVTRSGDNSTYIPIRASNITVSSSIKFKTNVEEYTEDALTLIQKATIYSYQLFSDIHNGQYKTRIGMIVERVPEVFIEGDFVDIYQTTSILIKATQQLAGRMEDAENELQQLKIENQLLKERVSQLEAKVA